ncbi:hypothetical protein ACMGDM_11310 [Sphingomonas sp. DT-51]
MTDAGNIDAATQAGKILVDIELPSGAVAFDLMVSDCSTLIERLLDAVLSASTGARDAC